ncbi:hypothetical protein [Terricaulis sp.]|uniref:hypothetical protein n=1 Tax=Terricaulis sp. TaxID=2768686 RepID=UPI003784AA9F
MFRRRRRRSAFARRTPPQVGYALIGLGVIAFIAAFVFFIRQSDTLAPAQAEVSVPVDAFRE